MIDKLIAIVGLGYVGLPLAVEFGKKAKVFGFDINKKRVSELKKGVDSTLESSFEEIVSSKNLSFTSNIEQFLLIFNLSHVGYIIPMTVVIVYSPPL